MISVLWCLHIYGPDDIHPAPSKAHAEAAAALFNASDVAARAAADDILLLAVVEPWPDTAESHASVVDDFMANWIVPKNWKAPPDPRAPALRTVTVDAQGVRFGENCWISHEQITNRPADALNSVDDITSRNYMAWLRGTA